MNTRFLSIVRRHRGEFLAGKHRSGRIHVGSRPRAVVRELRSCIHPEQRTRLAINKSGQPVKLARCAYYLGGIAGIRAALGLCQAFHL